MGQGQSGGAIHEATAVTALSRYRILTAVVLTVSYVAVKTAERDLWAVGFGLSVLAIILLTPEPAGVQPWRQHALRVVTACFVVVTLGSIFASVLG